MGGLWGLEVVYMSLCMLDMGPLVYLSYTSMLERRRRRSSKPLG
jgi:hypothetical protein